MSRPEDAAGPPPGSPPGAQGSPRPAAKKKPTREDLLAKALRDNLKRRKASAKKDRS